MEFNLFEEVRVKRDVNFLDRGIIVKAGKIGTIVEIVESLYKKGHLGYVVEIDGINDFNPTFTFEEDQIELIKK